MTSKLDITPLLDHEVMAALAKLDLQLDTLSLDTLPRIRELMAQQPPIELSDEVVREDFDVPARSGLTVRVHRPLTAVGSALPCIYWMHGGGLVLGTNRGDDQRFDHWCRRLGCAGVSVEYALAPEFPYPAPLEDCYHGLAWVFANATALGIDPQCVGIGGASAGAGLAAGLGLLARDRGEYALAFQALIYPMLDDRQITVSSQWRDPVWPPQANRFGWDSYLGGLKDDDIPPYAAPARAESLAGLAPTFISVGALDGFADEDIDFATRLRHAGVPTELHVYNGAPHGFDALTPGTAVARQARADIELWLSKRFAEAAGR